MSVIKNLICKECGSSVIKEIVGFNCPLCGWRSPSQVVEMSD